MSLDVSIKLSDHYSMWGLLGKFHLTFEEPGPVVVDFLSLDKNEQRQVVMGLRFKQITASVAVEDLYKVLVGTSAENVKPSSSLAVLKDAKGVLEHTKELHSKANEILAYKHITKIKKTICDSKDMRLLRTMLELEKAGERRKSVLMSLHTRIRHFEEEIAGKIKEASKKPVLERQTADLLEVEETDQEEVVLQVGEPMKITETDKEDVNIVSA